MLIIRSLHASLANSPELQANLRKVYVEYVNNLLDGEDNRLQLEEFLNNLNTANNISEIMLQARIQALTLLELNDPVVNLAFGLASVKPTFSWTT